MSRRSFLFVHGLCGNKEEAQRFAAVVNPLGWQVLAVDLPEHNGRQDGVRLVPWEAVPELQNVRNYMKERWQTLGVRAVSLGAWLALQAFAGERVERCLLSSPLLDMEKMIHGMMAQTGVSEERLRADPGSRRADSFMALSLLGQRALGFFPQLENGASVRCEG